MALRFLILAVLASSAMATTFTNCDKGPPPTELRVVDCAAQPCVVHPGGVVEAEVDFIATKSVEKLEAKVRATALNVTVNYTLPEPDACQTLVGSACPLESGDLATYKLDLKLPSILPTGVVVVELRVINPDGVGPDGGEDIMFCFSIQVDVVQNKI